MKTQFLEAIRVALAVVFAAITVSCQKISAVEILPEDLSGEEFVDLGLPSGTKWASRNMGAASAEKIGTYFTWGCTKEYDTFNSFSHSAYKEEMMREYPSAAQTKFVDYGDAGDTLRRFVVGGDKVGEVLPEIHDAAARYLGIKFHIPSAEDFIELYANTTWQWSSLKGVCGWKAVSRHNGNSVFFPATPFRYEDTSGWKSLGSYWTSQGALPSEDFDNPDTPSRVLIFTFNATVLRVKDYYRKSRLPIRPVEK